MLGRRGGGCFRSMVVSLSMYLKLFDFACVLKLFLWLNYLIFRLESSMSGLENFLCAITVLDYRFLANGLCTDRLITEDWSKLSFSEFSIFWSKFKTLFFSVCTKSTSTGLSSSTTFLSKPSSTFSSASLQYAWLFSDLVSNIIFDYCLEMVLNLIET